MTMRPVRTLLLMATLALVVGLHGQPVDAQSRPDFTGRWEYVQPARHARRELADLGVRPAPELTITHVATALTSACSPPATHPRCGTRELGVSGGAITATGSQASSQGFWFGSELVMVSAIADGPASEPPRGASYTERWSLDDRGRLRISIIGREATAINTTLVYRRRQGPVP